jgi:hypothetical protein
MAIYKIYFKCIFIARWEFCVMVRGTVLLHRDILIDDHWMKHPCRRYDREPRLTAV